MRVLLLITFRPEFKPVWAEYSHVTSLTLNRFSRRQSADLIAAITGGKVLPPEVQQAILAKTDGVPLYIEALTENVLESGLLTEGQRIIYLEGLIKGLAHSRQSARVAHGTGGPIGAGEGNRPSRGRDWT